MHSEKTFIGIDLGTSGCRACLIDCNEKLLKEVRADFPEPLIHGAEVEQDADLWWPVVSQVLQQLCQHPAASTLAAISVDGTSSTVVLTDQNYRPLAPALMYNDSRASAEAELLKSIAPEQAGAVHGASSSLSKLLWLIKQHPQQQAATKKILHQADFISGQLSGRFISDYNNCLKTGFDPQTKSWPSWLWQLNIPTNMLPEVVAPGTVTGQLTPANRKHFGLEHEVSIVAGTTDSIAGFLATGATEIGDAVSSLGSTLAIKILSEHPINSAEQGVYSHRINAAWLAGGASNTGGTVLRQFFNDAELQTLSEGLSFKQATGLAYYPLPKTGERFPHNDPHKQPCLTPQPEDKQVFLQAILEALTAVEKQSYDVLKAKGAPVIKRLFTIGGGSKNKKWMQYRAKQLDSEVIIPDHTEACYGSALLAKQGYLADTDTSDPKG
ncbi:MAG: FGGY-family carbohydrate kinase [Gammaproteobacteria bacterium]|nr:FGGY-family carbohydrate kinase [Gammaproteobacteria bacterium]